MESPEKIAPPTDEAIRARILAALALRPEMKPTDLVLAVSNGIVFIDGFVETLNAKLHIHKLAEDESGVLEIRDNRPEYSARPEKPCAGAK